MKDDNLKALIKESYGITPAPAGLFTRIRDEAESEQVILNNKRVDFSRPNPLVSKTDPEEQKETVVSLGLFKKNHTKKSAIITISAAAACIVLCIVTLAVTGVFSKSKPQETPMSQAMLPEDKDDGQASEDITALPAGVSPRVSAKMGEKETLVSANVVSLSEGQTESEDILFPASITPDSSMEVVEFGRIVTLSFEDEAPKKVEIYPELYSSDGQKTEHPVEPLFSFTTETMTIDSLLEPLPATVSEDGKKISFPVLDYYGSIGIAEQNKENGSDFYYLFLAKCEFDDRSVDYTVTVHTDNTSDTVLAKVIQAEPVILVKPMTERELFANLSQVTLSDVRYARFLNKELESEPIEKYELKPDDVILFKYNGLEPGNAFPQVIENALVYINPLSEEFPLASMSLKDLIASYGTVKDLVYFNLSTGVDEYATDDPARVEALMTALSEVKVRGTYAYEVSDGTWDELGSEGDEMWQISFGFEGSEEKLVLRINPLEIVTARTSELLPEGQSSVKLIFDEETALSSEKVKELADPGLLSDSSEKSPEQVLALALNATYEVIGNDFVERRMEFDRGYSVDLNGDGSQDHLYASCVPLKEPTGVSGFGIVLVINGKLFDWGYVSNPDGSHRLVYPDSSCYDLIDVKKDDAYIEIVFSDFGPSEDYSCMFFDYEEGSLNYLGAVEGDLPKTHSNNGGLRVKGDGLVGTKKRLSIVQNWLADTDYKLTERRRLSEVEREYYYPVTGVNVTARFDLVVYSAMDMDSELVTIPAGPVSLPMTDNDHFVMVKGADGTEGYMYLANDCITTMDDEPHVTSVFDGLFLAD